MPRAASTSERPRRVLAAVLAMALAAGCRGPAPTLVATFPAFEGEVVLEIRDADPAAARAAHAEVEAALRADSASWHAWEDSDVTRINAALAAGDNAPAPAPLLELVARARPLVDASGGLFDPAIGGLIAAWGFHTGSFPVVAPPPSRQRVTRWLANRPRLQDLQVDGDRVRSDNPALQLDFGAMAEGAAGERALRILRRHGIRQARIGFGSDDAVVLGDGAGEPWTVTLRDPFGGDLGQVRLGDGEALFSTGNFSRFRASASGARWPHILDPRTGHPARGAAAVAVVATDPVRADVAAAALYVAGPAGFEATARALRVSCALLLTDENEMLVTAAMRPRLALHRDPVPLGPPLDLGASCGA